MSQPSVRSLNNGLEIAVAPEAKGILGRFQTKGGNELIFRKQSGVRPADDPRGENNSKAVTIESNLIDQSTKPTDLA